MGVVNVGTVANDGTGDSIRAGGQKINSAFVDVVAQVIPPSSIPESMLDDDAASTRVIADLAVTNAKLANMAQATVKGRADGAGTGAPVDLTGPQLLAIPAYQRPGITSPALRTLAQKSSDYVDLRDWDGLDLTGANASTTIVQRAIDDLENTGDKLNIPPGIITLDATIDLRGRCAIEGPNWPGVDDGSTSAWFKIAHTGRGFYSDSTTGSYDICRVGTYRNQPTPGVGWTPTGATDYDFWLSAQDVHIDQVCLLNPSYAVRLEPVSGGAGRLNLTNVRSQPFKEGITILGSYDTCRLNNVHVWPFWSQDANIKAYMQANLESYRSFRNDNAFFSQIFSIWHKIGLYLGEYAGSGPSYPSGSTSKLRILGGDFDIGTQGIVCAADGVTLDAFGLSIQGRDDASVSASALIEASGDNSSLTFAGGDIKQAGGSLIRLDGTGNRVALNGVRTGVFNLSAGAWPAFEAASGNTITIDGHIHPAQTLTYGGAGVIESPEWRSWTPTITAEAGAFAITPTTTSPVYRRVKGVVEGELKINVAAAGVGTAATGVVFTLPITPSSARGGGCGRELAVNGKGLSVTIASGGTTASIVAADNTFPGVNNSQMFVQFKYSV